MEIEYLAVQLITFSRYKSSHSSRGERDPLSLHPSPSRSKIERLFKVLRGEKVG